jgi:hypothetical protein
MQIAGDPMTQMRVPWLEPPQANHPLSAIRRTGVVQDVSGLPATVGVNIAGDTSNIIQLPYVGAPPAFGDVVIILGNSGDHVVIGAVAPSLGPTWTALTGLASGANAGTPTPSWMKDGRGNVRMTGQITATTTFAGSGTDLIASLPAAIVPGGDRLIPAATNFASTNHPARFTILATGHFQIHCAASEISAVYLDVIDYYV